MRSLSNNSLFQRFAGHEVILIYITCYITCEKAKTAIRCLAEKRVCIL